VRAFLGSALALTVAGSPAVTAEVLLALRASFNQATGQAVPVWSPVAERRLEVDHG
jgi:hypothetical protein